ncbi:peptidase domain-containing ABC transporter [Pedobacter hartonius]|uniref:Bacteriocin-processing peptidase. Cysteine peptidase. MEROPS family C39 n=1 Tax=Pedobacter hartonius TaxID=425514 RepID=A0A1H3ZKM0_9SPHI|nr:peptidase domain-containing ABC transporter [Pedobacter hartonius]SEA23814.1 bacteriocin-processing peptidase. Cysteine peptidase. MEROPS family C39 [Pedobacter hartonius]
MNAKKGAHLGRYFPLKKKHKRTAVRQHDVTDCGAACIASIAAHYDLDLPIARIRQMASTDTKGTNILGLIEASTRIGFTAKGLRGDFENLPNIPLPVIAHVNQNNMAHYVVIYKITKAYVEVMDPAYGERQKLDHDEFKKKWTGVLVLLLPGDDFSAGTERISIEQRFFYLLKPHRSVLLQVLVGSVFYTILGLSTSIFLQKIVDNVLPDGNMNLLNLMGTVMIGIIFLQIFVNHAKTLLTIKTGQQIDARLILGYYKHLLRLPQQFFDTMRVGEIISRMNDAVKIRTFINDVLVGFLVNLFILFFSFALMFTYYWKLALIMFTVVPLYAVVYYFSNRLNKNTQRKLMEKTAELENQLVESVTAVSTIKRFGLEEYTNLKTEIRFINLLRTIYTSGTNALWIGNAGGFISSVFAVILLWTGATFVVANMITAGELLSFYAIIGYFTGPVVSLIGMNRVLQDARIAADRLFEIMDLERETTENRADLTVDMLGDILFKNVGFRYGTRVTVFEDFSLRVPRGRITAIVGESGSGKTTLLSLLQNIYSLQSGSIQIGDYDIKYITNDSLRKIVGVVPQDVHLFAGNVIDNIAIGDMEPDMKKIIRICGEINILEFIEKLPNGFETYLGENAGNLSGGQRQRLAIARALYREPEILILDEATSSLDSTAEEYIFKTIACLRAQGKTIILIAHRLSTVVNADQISVLSNGKLIEEGTHKELLQRKAAYAGMWQKQFPLMVDI